VLQVVNIMYLLCMQRAQGLDETDQHVYSDVAMVVISVLFTFISFGINFLGAQRLARILRQTLAAVAPVMSHVQQKVSQSSTKLMSALLL
jgi:hypothetical protein